MTDSAFQGELMLAGWKDTHNGGATVTFWLPDPAELDVFRGMTSKKGNVAGQRFMAVLVEIGDDEKAAAQERNVEHVVTDGHAQSGVPAAAAPNKLAAYLHTSGYFRNPKLWAALDEARIYTEAQHKTWIEAQDCIGWGAMEHMGDICLHHVKAASVPASGRGQNPQKPPSWYGVPLCHNHHRSWAHGTGSLCATREDKQRLLEKAVGLTADQVKEAMKKHIGIESLRELTLDRLQKFEGEIGLTLTKWSDK